MNFQLKTFAERVIIDLKKLQKRNIERTLPKSKKINVPFYSQWESKDLVGNIIAGNLDPRKDPRWKNSGAKNSEEYFHWSWNTCGMACLKMILESMGVGNQHIVTLGKKCMQYGGYSIDKTAYREGDYKHSIDGLYYRPFVTFIKQEFHIDSKIVSPLILEEILEYISKNKLVMASVRPRIRIPSDDTVQKGGHLILIVGYNLSSQTLLFHNPSGLPKKSQEYASISFQDFEKFFVHRGIVIDQAIL